MSQLEEIRLINEAQIKYLQKMGKITKRNEIIREMLQDEGVFFKINEITAYVILEDIGVEKDKIILVYSKLKSYDNYLSYKGNLENNN